jgi:hypothetical protein
MEHEMINNQKQQQQNVLYTSPAKSFNILEIVLPRPQATSATIFLSVR